MDQSENYWPAVLHNVGKASRVWNRQGELLQRKGAETRVSTMFYQVVVQSVLFFGAETWVLSEAMSRKLEGVYVGYLW